MRKGDEDFSGLKTISAFDRGDGSTIPVGFDSQHLQKISPPTLFVESLVEQLCKLIEKDPRTQRNIYLTICQKLHQMNLIEETYKVEEFQCIRSHYQKALYQIVTVAKATSVETKAICSLPFQLSLGPESALEWSRYATEFQELEYIAKGGFGYVFKSRHKLDGEEYAVKKICVRYRNVEGFLNNLREVKMLARLNNPNIVSYKAAWLEPVHRKEAPPLPPTKEESTNGESFEVVFEESGQGVESEPQEKNEEETELSTSVETSEYSRTVSSNGRGALCNVMSYNYRYSSSGRPSYRPNHFATLFIQMQLCQMTLRQWLDKRNMSNDPVDVRQVLEIFKQIVRGVQYIHSQDIVHHDIKPSNIFVSKDLKEVQVGDFGLACCLLTHLTPFSVVSTSHQKGPVGTKLYAAPEQLRNICDPKSDIYSLGIVLFELLEPFSTAMERSKLIQRLKTGHLPTDLTTKYPDLANIISRTVTTSAKKRPSSAELLDEIEETESLNSLKIIEEQEVIIKQLRSENIAKDKEIELLKKQIEGMMAQTRKKTDE